MALGELGEVENIKKKIKNLEIQGAENVAKACLSAASILLDKAPHLLSKKLNELALVRSTEPAARNVSRAVIQAFEDGGVEKAREKIQELLEFLKASRKKISQYGARKIKDGCTVITHCHSSTLMSVFREAAKKKEFEVIVTETRPLYQGKLTARELTEMGVDVTYIVDSAAYFFMERADIYMTGADAITSDGFVANKIGTALIACAAKRFSVPYYAVCSSLKFDESTAEGFPERIEEREHREILDEEIGVRVRNPAFDLTPPDMITGIISEFGVLPVEGFVLKNLATKDKVED